MNPHDHTHRDPPLCRMMQSEGSILKLLAPLQKSMISAPSASGIASMITQAFRSVIIFDRTTSSAAPQYLYAISALQALNLPVMSRVRA